MEALRMEKIFEELKASLDERDAAREVMLSRSREITRLSGNAISKMVSGDMEVALEDLERMRKVKEEMIASLQNHPELLHSPASWNALGEFVEAELLYRVIRGEKLPGPGDLMVDPVPYLLGMADLIGELRRTALEEVKKGSISRAWELLNKMEEIFAQLSPLDYPDAIIPGLRHKVDVNRRLIDDTKYFLLDMESRLRLERALKECGEKRG